MQNVLSIPTQPPDRTSGSTDFAIIYSLLRRSGFSDPDARTLVEPVLAEVESLTDAEAVKKDRDPLPGVRDCISTLNTMGVLQTVATGNSRTKAHAKLSAADVQYLLDLRCAAYGSATSDRAAIVRTAIRRAGLVTGGNSDRFSPSHTVVVGDTEADVVAGLDCGCRCVGVCTGSATREQLYAAGAHLVVDDLRIGLPAIKDLIESLWH